MKPILKRSLCSALGLAMCLSLVSCGTKDTEVVVDEYGEFESSAVNSDESDSDNSNSAETDSAEVSSGDASNDTNSEEIISTGKMFIETGGGQSVQEIYGEKVDWQDSFTVGGMGLNVDTFYNVPAVDGMNVYNMRKVSPDSIDEEAIVESLLGSSAKKLDEIKYTENNDYMMMMYKYRSLLDARELYKIHDQGYMYINAVTNRTLIDSSSEETFKWLDDSDLSIHMYEGLYNGIRFGLLIAYDYSGNSRVIHFAPISISEYFPDYDFKSLLVTSSNDSIGNPLEIENNCDMTIDEVKEEAEKLISDDLHLRGYEITDSSANYKMNIFDNAASFYSFNLDSSFEDGAFILRFSDADYISTLRYDYDGMGIDYDILSEQNDLYSEYLETHDKDEFFMFMTDHSQAVTDSLAEPNFTTDGYSVYLQSEFNTDDLTDDNSFFYTGTPDTGFIQYTSRGLFQVDITTVYEITDITENVKLMDFDHIKDRIKEQLESEGAVDSSQLENADVLTVTSFELNYSMYFDDEEGEEFMYIPVWEVDAHGNTQPSLYAHMYFSAMDGSYIGVSYLEHGYY